jgi:alginate O-acetyltransferase complex protein AlgI
MIFNSIEYLLFLPLVCLIYYLTAHKFRWVVLFFASCIFYMWLVPEYILCLFFLILVDFFMAKKIHSTEALKKRKLLLVISILSNFGLLFYFKYYDFFISTINPLVLELFGRQISLSNDILPIGLSFHTFQSVSYVIDVYRKEQKPETHLGIYSTYVLFFPQMVAGPIERYSNLGTALNQQHFFKLEYLKRSIQLLVVGFFYKMVIADNCGAYVNKVYFHWDDYGAANAFFAFFLFAIQVYCDFFAYSLIAQGSAQLFGIRLMDNFKFPFFATNIIEFWKRWHISLTSWFRNYVFIPMGGSKHGKLRQQWNIFIVFALSGLWHGAAWGYIIFGVMHALYYIVTINIPEGPFAFIPKLIKIIVNFLICMLLFNFFRSVILSDTVTAFKALFNFNIPYKDIGLDPFLFVLIASVFVLESYVIKKDNYTDFFSSLNSRIKVAVLCVMLFFIMIYSAIEQLQFIYFQF